MINDNSNTNNIKITFLTESKNEKLPNWYHRQSQRNPSVVLMLIIYNKIIIKCFLTLY